MSEHPFEKIIQHSQRGGKISLELDRISQAAADKAETEILVDFWKSCSDHTPSYLSAIATVAAFKDIQIQARVACDKLNADQTAMVMETAGKYLIHEAATLREMAAAKLRVMHENPLPGDFT